MLLVIRSLGPGGAERLVLDQLRLGDRSAFDYELFVARPRQPDLLGEARALGVPVHLGYRAGRPWPAALRAVATGGFDVVHSHLPLAAVAARCVLRLWPAARRPRLVYTEHNRWPSYRPTLRWLNRATVRLEDLVLAVSADAAESIRWPARRPVRVLPHGIDLSALELDGGERRRLRDELGLPDDAVIVGTVANLRREKDQATLLRAFADADLGAGVTLAIVGQGPLDAELRALAARLGLGARVRFLGYRDDALRVMAGFDLFTLSSLHEGRPVALMEAMALGRPVVVTAAGGMAEMVEDGVSGVVTPPGDAPALASALRRLVLDAEARARLGRGAATAAGAFDAARAFRAIEALYRELAAR